MGDHGAYEPDGDGPRCAWCAASPGVWVHRLDPDRSRHRVYGKEHIWAQELALCERCEELFLAGADEALVAAHERTWQRTAQDVDEGVRAPLAALRRADLGDPVHRSRWLPPGAAELIAQGFAPAEELTGSPTVPQAWPAAHRRTLPDTRPDRLTDPYVLLRSPWPGTPVRDVLTLLWQWLEPQHYPDGDAGAWERDRIHTYLSQAGPPPPRSPGRPGSRHGPRGRPVRRRV